jgi:hypothetical protein
VTTNLTEKLTAVVAELLSTEGTSLGAEDTQLIHLRHLAGITWAEYLELIVLKLETIEAAAIVYLQNNIGSADPDFTGVETCSVTLGSAAPRMGSNGRTYADWVTLPSGTTLAGLDGITGVQGLLADRETHWQGVKYYIRSNKPTFTFSPTDNTIRKSGQIYTITSAADIVFAPSIEGEGEITAYLCGDVLGTEPEYVDYDSIFDPIPGDEKNRISWGSTLGSNVHPDIGAYGTNYVFRYGDFNGYGFSQPAGGGAGAFRVVYWDMSGTINTFTVSLGVENFISVPTQCLLIDDFLIGNTFSVRMRRP